MRAFRGPGKPAGAILAITVFASIVVGGPAAADVGALAPQGCVDDNDIGPDTCAQSTDGLTGAASVAVSADGTSVYVASPPDDAVVRFTRDPATGALAPQGCVDDNDPPAGPDDCAQSTDGLDGAISVALSPDGRSVYVASFTDDAVVRFTRDTSTGALTPGGCIDDNDPPAGPDTCAQSTDGLDGAKSVAVSPDGRSVYVASSFDDAVVRLARDLDTGALSPQGCIDDNDPPAGPDTCAQSTDGLDGASSGAVSRDGKSLYVTSSSDDAVVHLARDLSTGALTPQGCVDDNDGPAGPDACAQSTDGLDGANSIAVSPDGASAYAGSSTDQAVVHLARNLSTGALTPVSCVDDDETGPDACPQSADGLAIVEGVAASPDAASVYAVSGGDDAVVRLDRDIFTGALNPRGCVDDNDFPLDACGQSSDGMDDLASVALSLDGRSLYITAEDDHALVRFEREPDTDPPNTRIKKGPKHTTSSARARFGFTSDEPASTFECKLEGRRFKPCDSPKRYKNLEPGRHLFKVRATDLIGNTDPTPARRRWRIEERD